MSSLKVIKGKIRSVSKITQVTKAMEAVSAVKMRKSQKRAIDARPYAQSALSILKRLSQVEELSQHPLVRPRVEIKKSAVLLITSDRGLAGALNANIVRKMHALIQEKNLSPENTVLFCVGKKGAEHFARRGWHVEKRFERWSESDFSSEYTKNLAEDLIIRYRTENFDKLYVVYTNFLSSFIQEPVIREVLPISFDAVTAIIEGITPTQGMFSDERTQETTSRYIFEPSAGEVLDMLVPFLLSIELYHAVLESNASEHSARMVAMKSASDRASDMQKSLTLSYNKQRQSAITAEISEIISGIEAMLE